MEIIVKEDSQSAITPGTGNWPAVQAAVEALEDYDFAAVQELDAADVCETNKNLP